jgi:hypothetical protein
MKSESDKYQVGALTSVMKYFAMAMAIVYLIGGLTLIFQVGNLVDMPDAYRIPLGVCLMLYGAFRSYRVYGKYFKKK